MKTILILLPIGIITNIFFKIRYGNYNVDTIDNYIQYFFKEQTWFTIGIFCSLSVFIHYLQTIIIPFSMIKIGKYKSEYDKWRISEMINSKKTINFLNKAKRKQIIKIYKFYSEISVIIILWLICFKSYFVLIPILFICMSLIFISKALNIFFIKKP